MIALVFALLRLASGSMLHGVVRSSEDGTALAVAMIEAVATDSTHAYHRAFTDSTGAYSFGVLSPGSYRLRVSHPGYDTRELEVLLAGTSPVDIDIALAAQPQRLADVRVFAAARAPVDDSAAAARVAERDVGATILSGDALHQDPALTSADVLQSFTTRGAATARDEIPTALHVHGAAASENAVLLDGVPLFNPYHASGTLSAIDPDVIASATLHSGAPGAMLGDATGSVAALTSRESDTSVVTTEGAFGARTLRGSLSIPLRAVNGSALVSARRSMDAPFSDGHDGGANAASFQDQFARATIPLHGGALEAFAFHSGDRLAFDATMEHYDDAGERSDEKLRAVPSQSNALSWTTGTDALQWRSGGDTQWEVRAWRTRFDADFGWSTAAQLRSSYEQLGSSADRKWTMRGLHLAAGIDADKLNVGYEVHGRLDPAALSLALHGSPLVMSAFGEARGTVGDRWSYALGLRAPVMAPDGAGLEPRLSVRFAPGRRVSLGLGYSRMHQYVQSLRNEESLFDALAGITLPVSAGSTANGQTIPVATADQVASSLDARLTSTLSLSAIAYARHESGLALVAPVSAEPFAVSTFTTGSADSHGLTMALERTGGRVSGEIAYSIALAQRRSGSGTYAPSFASAHALSLGVGARVWPSTVLRAAASFDSGLPASVYGDPLEWTPTTPASGSGDLAGTPEHVLGALNGARLPPYFRLDLGIRREWELRMFGISAHVEADAAVINVLGRRNALGLAQAEDGVPQSLRFPGRGLQLGFGWRH